MSRLGDTLLFQSFGEEVGHELFKLAADDAPASPCAASKTNEVLARSDKHNDQTENMKASRDAGVLYYPNPFLQNVILRVDGEQSEQYHLDVFTLDGAAVDRYEALNCNQAYELGDRWNTGIYVLKISVGRKMLTQKVVKIK